jgi:hypothetical protein
MRHILALALVGGCALASETAHAQWGYYDSPYGGHRHGSYYGSYYGHGGHDYVPHWHDTYTPHGRLRWYGTGYHDYVPHWHTYSPYSYRGHSHSPWGYTRSYYPRYPYYYAPW